jgi:NAD(P)-dependent dehydrogenase (short-subunit alcohol dehydrogenase family)
MNAERVFLVTGAASGIGRALIHALAQRGHRVVAGDLDVPGLDEAARADGWPASVSRLALDVRDREAWQRALDHTLATFGRLDVLLNVAGFLQPGWVKDLTAADIDRHLDVNVKGVIHGSQVAARHFLSVKAGHIITIGSLASLAPVPGLSLYSCSKFAVRGFTLALAQELSPHGIKVTLVMPDAVQTPMLVKQVDHDEAAMTFSGASTPLSVDDVTRAILDHAVPDAPLEVTLPWSRGLIARLATFWPAAVVSLGPLFIKKGLTAQARLRGERKRGE